MLRNLHVKNLAIIEEAEVDFGEGLNILTGETGAGKSILMGAVNLALGERAPKEMLKPGKEALVELVFTVDEKTEARLAALSVEAEDHEVILCRKVSETHSTARLNGETVPLSRLKEAAELLINIHGQAEHTVLKQKKMHLTLLDQFGDAAFRQALSAYKEAYQALLAAEKAYAAVDLDDREQQRELDLISYEVQELSEAELQEDEDEALELTVRKLSNMKKIKEAAEQARKLTTGCDSCASEQIGRALSELLSVREYDPAISDLADELSNIDNLLSDFSRSLTRAFDAEDCDEEAYYTATQRLDLLNRFKQKYAPTIPGMLALLDEKQERMELLQHLSEKKEALAAALKGAKDCAVSEAEALSAMRKERAEAFSREMMTALMDLNFLDVRFEVAFTPLPKPGPDGSDDVQFMIALNPGEPLKPLQKVASGGELSRIMLAMKSVASEESGVGAMIFDEIDAGISGRTAQKVSEKLERLSRETQILCITHLPQIAAMADRHFLIEKEEKDGSTVSSIRTLSPSDSTEELARMLGGVSITDAVRQNAAEMKALAERLKQEA